MEQLKQLPDVQEALSQTCPEEAPPTRPAPARTGDMVFLGTMLLFFVCLGVGNYLLRVGFFDLLGRYAPFLQRAITAAMAITLVLVAARLIEVYAIGRVRSPVSRYNLKRLVQLLVAFGSGFIVLSVVFANWYPAVVSLGVLSVVIGLAVQTPVTSLLGWVYLMVRHPYRVGDRIKMGDVTGDVIDVSYLDTTLWEFGGDYLSTDHPSGRVIRFPNSEVLSSTVINYSWPVFPYIWNEIIFHVAYDSDLEFVGQVMREVAEQEIGPEMLERVKVYRELLARTPVDELQVREHPSVAFRVSSNTWLEAIVRYLVHPREAGRVKTALIKKMLKRLNEHPDKVGFPKSNTR